MKLTKRGAQIALIVSVCVLVIVLLLLVYEVRKEFFIRESVNLVLLSPQEASVTRIINVSADYPDMAQVTLKIASSEKALIVHEIVPEGSVLYAITTQADYPVFSFKQSNNSWFVADSEPLSNLEIKYITNSSTAISDITQISYVNESGDIISGMAQTTTLVGGNTGTTTTTSSGSGGSGGGGGGGGSGGSSGGGSGSSIRVNNNSSNVVLNESNVVNQETRTTQDVNVNNISSESKGVISSKIIILLVAVIALIICIMILGMRIRKGLK